MCFEPTLFDSPMYETANEAVLFCQAHLEKSGLTVARTLEGLAPVNGAVVGRLTYRALQDMLPRVTDAKARELITIALNAVERALELQPLRAAS